MRSPRELWLSAVSWRLTAAIDFARRLRDLEADFNTDGGLVAKCFRFFADGVLRNGRIGLRFCM